MDPATRASHRLRSVLPASGEMPPDSESPSASRLMGSAPDHWSGPPASTAVLEPVSARPAQPVVETLVPPPLTVPDPARPRRPVGLSSALLQLGALAVLAYLCLFNFSVVRGSSMAPRIHDGDRILIDHFSYMLTPVDRGDIVVLKYPLDPTVDYIKRVIGLPGDHVRLEDGRVFVNGDELVEPYVDDRDVFSDVDVEVLPAHYFVLGDNRPRSCDSREFGQVPAGYVRGKVEMRVWPLQRAGLIDA